MAPKKVNSKAVAANEKKAENQRAKDAIKQQQEEAKVAAEWGQGSKDRSRLEQEQQKREEQLRKKAEREALLAEEEASIKSAKPSKVADRKTAKNDQFAKDAIPQYTASNLDDALDLMTLVTESKGPSDRIEKHPERRMKSAYAAFEERELPLLKAENPGLRLSQLKQQLQKKWKKSPENPMVSRGKETNNENQESVAYNASQEEISGFKEAAKEKTLQRLEKK